MIRWMPFALLGYLSVFHLSGQKVNDQYQYFIKKTTHPVRIDGVIDEEAWEDVQIAENFTQVLPMDTSAAWLNTQVRFTYDDKNLYFSFVNHNNKIPGKWIVESLKRDWSFNKNDNNLLFIDPFDDQTNGFTFGSNAMGGVWDGLMTDGSAVNLAWENKWDMKVTYDEDKWIWEGAIPFKTLRYKKELTLWGINFSRLDLKTTEKSVWAPVPRQFPTAALAFTGNLVWDQAPPSPGANISVIPYVTASSIKNFMAEKPARNTFDFGTDIKYGVSSAMNLDITFNPDFSQVDVDRQQINLDRFELFFPERRQFFIENADLFNNFGTQGIRPFFSRRIGLTAPITYGARLSGRLDKDWRLGVMNMHTGSVDNEVPSQNFSALVLQRRVFSRSNISLMLVNKESIGIDRLLPEQQNKFTAFNRNIGLEYNLASADNMWRGKLLYLTSITPEGKNDDAAFSGSIIYSKRRWNISTGIERVGERYLAEVGFVPRTNYTASRGMVSHLFFPQKSKHILSHGPGMGSIMYFDQKLTKNVEHETYLFYRINFRNTATLEAWTARDFITLQSDVDPTNFTGVRLLQGTKHAWGAWGTMFNSKPQSLFTYSFATRQGGYFANGKRLRLEGEAGYRFQPYVSLGASVNYNHIAFGDNAEVPLSLTNTAYNFWLISPRVELTLTNNFFITGLAQYNNQIDNININIRMQWRYSLASDIFLVYTDNYFTDIFRSKNRAVVFKVNYWWNV